MDKTKLLEGKTLAAEILAALPERCEAIKNIRGRAPALAIINFYPNSPAGIYSNTKIKACKKAGIETKLFTPSEQDGYASFIKLINELKQDIAYDAIMVEKPLPDNFDIQKTWDLFPPEKDVDGLSTLNMGRLFRIKKFEEIEQNSFSVPCTAFAVIKLLKYHGIDIVKKNIAIAGRSNVAGKPMAHMLMSLNATVTLCHSNTQNEHEIFKRSDIVISAVGKAAWIKKDMLKHGAIVIDIGTNLNPDGKLCGDIDSSCSEICHAISPVPGGVGPITNALLLEAVVKNAEYGIKGRE